MAKHLQRDIDRLKNKALSLSGVVEQNLRESIRSLVDRDAERAREVIAKDEDIDNLEVEVEEECLKILALHQPVAIDLRFIIAVLKMNNDLERIGDLAVNVAEHAISLAEADPIEAPYDIPGMAEIVQRMMKNGLDALVNVDAELARDVCQADDEVDEIHVSVFAKVEAAIKDRPELLGLYIHHLAISRNLERIADHITNIAEDVIYMVEGVIRRHGVAESD